MLFNVLKNQQLCRLILILRFCKNIIGENNSTFFHVLYVYGQYLFRQGMIDKANQIFNQIQTKALLINDLESLGISYNCLGLMCYRLVFNNYLFNARLYSVE